MCREEFRAKNMGVQLWGCWQVSPSLPISPFRKGLDCELVALLEALDTRLGEPSTRIVCVAMASLRILLNCGGAEPSSALAAVPKVLARRYRGPFAFRSLRKTPFPSRVLSTEGGGEAHSPCNM